MPEWRDVDQWQGVVQNPQQNRAQNDARDFSGASCDADSTKHTCRDDAQLVARSCVTLCGSKFGYPQNARKSRQSTHDRVHEPQNFIVVDPADFRGIRVAAHCVNLSACPGVCNEVERDEVNDDCDHDEGIEPENGAGRNRFEGVRHLVRADPFAAADHERHAAKCVHHAERCDDGKYTCLGDEQADDHAADDTDCCPEQNGEQRMRIRVSAYGHGRNHPGQSERRPDRQVNSSRHDDQHHADCQNAQNGRIRDHVIDIFQRQKAGVAQLYPYAQKQNEYEQAQLPKLGDAGTCGSPLQRIFWHFFHHLFPCPLRAERL